MGFSTIFLLSDISIHAPRAGSDAVRSVAHPPDILISIHAPRAGSDRYDMATSAAATQFQSTLPVRGATWRTSWTMPHWPFQSTLPVRGAT